MTNRTPSPPEEKFPLTPITPKGLRVFTATGEMWLSSSSRATDKVEQTTGQDELVLTELPKLAGAERVLLAVRGQAGHNVKQANRRFETFMGEQAVINAKQDEFNREHARKLSQVHHSLVDSFTDMTMFSILTFVVQATTGQHPFERESANHPMKSHLRHIIFNERGPSFRKIWSIKFARQLNDPTTLERFLAGVDVPRRHKQAHLELNPTRLTSNAFEIERLNYRAELDGDNQYTLALQYLLIVLRADHWSASIIAHINDDGSAYPEIPGRQLERFKDFF